MFRTSGALVLFAAIAAESWLAQQRGVWKLADRLAGRPLFPPSPPSLIEYELRLVEFPSVPTLRRLH